MTTHYVCCEKYDNLWDLLETSADYNYLVRNNLWIEETQELYFLPFETKKELDSIGDQLDNANVFNIFNGMATLNGLQWSVKEKYIDELREYYHCDDEAIKSFFGDIFL